MNVQLTNSICRLVAIFGWVLLTAPTAVFAIQAEPTSSSVGELANDPEILAFLSDIVENDKTIPGMVAAIVTANEPIRIAAAGVRKSDSEESLTVNDIMHLGSCTKAITATAIGRLLDQEKIRLDLTIEEALPELSEKIHEDYATVTLQQLLQHRSGMPANAQSWWLQGGDDLSELRMKIASVILKQKPEYEPGTKYQYSNLGYVVAGLMAAQAAGKSWEELMREEVFEVLELDSAGFGIPGTKGQTDQPWGHRIIEGEPKPVQFDNAPALGPAGTVHMNLSDWGKFVMIHAREENNGYLSDETMQSLHDPGDEGTYALGWGVHPRGWAGGNALSHSGSNTMWYCTAWVAPKKRTAYLVATNVMGKDIPKVVDRTVGKLIELNK